MAETIKYYPPAGPDRRSPETIEKQTYEYVPPVGPGSKSLPPIGDYRDLPQGFIPKIPKSSKK